MAKCVAFGPGDSFIAVPSTAHPPFWVVGDEGSESAAELRLFDLIDEAQEAAAA